MENEISFDDVVAVSLYVQAQSKDVLDNEKKFGLMQTCIVAMYSGMPIEEVMASVDDIITRWAAFTNGQITVEELLGEENMAQLRTALNEYAQEEGSVIPSTDSRTIH